MSAPALDRRERLRASTVEEIKQTARRLMAESGSVEARFSEIAREMGMTAPALYRYFADRDELLTALIADGYNDLADALAAGRDGAASDTWSRFTGVATAYRAWAIEDRSRYALVFGMPIAGYAAPEDSKTTVDARRGLAVVLSVLRDAAERGELQSPFERRRGPLNSALREVLPDVKQDQHQAALHVWMGLHGSVSLEACGHLSMLSEAARAELYDGQVGLLGVAIGLPPRTS